MTQNLQDCNLFSRCDLCRTSTPEERSSRPHLPPFAESFSLCGPMVFCNLFQLCTSLKRFL
uniref:Uncharacterized protein n=1 Tax=Myripristis murdjan TaxID=586833 RepID=A0A667XSL0_9TELE